MNVDQKKISQSLLYLLIVLLPVQLGSFFFFDFSYIFGVRIDYLAPALYLTDILTFSLIILNSSHIPKKISLFFFLLLSFVALNVMAAHNSALALYRWIKIIEMVLLFVVIKDLKLHRKMILMAFISFSLIELILALLQISFGSSMQGVWYYLGERNFDLSTPSIAKVSLHGVEVLRAYGTFSHPNSLGGFFVLLYTYILFSHSFTKYKLLKYASLLAITLLVALSFSKIALIAYVLATIYFVIKDGVKSCYFCSFSKIFVALCIAFIFLQAKGDSHTVEKRMYLATSAYHIFLQHPWTGTGLGNYLYAQSKISNPYPYHFLEPVHTIALLALTELGIPLFLLLLYAVRLALKGITSNPATIALVGVVLFTGMFDHYWLTLQQNMLLLPVLFALLKNEDKYDKIDRT